MECTCLYVFVIVYDFVDVFYVDLWTDISESVLCNWGCWDDTSDVYEYLEIDEVFQYKT